MNRNPVLMSENSPQIHKVILCLGSNMPEAATAVELAIRWLETILTDCRTTGPFATEPEGSDIAGRPYFNALVAGATTMDASQLISAAKEYERAHGRLPEHRSTGNVAIDIDLVIFDNVIVDDVNYRSAYFRKGMELLGKSR